VTFLRIVVHLSLELLDAESESSAVLQNHGNYFLNDTASDPRRLEIS
jgi:hypothetical protein